VIKRAPGMLMLMITGMLITLITLITLLVCLC